MRLTDESDDPRRPSEQSEIPPGRETLGALKALADDLARSSRAPNTRRAYSGAWNAFAEWSNAHGLQSLPASPETVAIYLAHVVANGRRTGTVQGALVALSQVHLDAGYPSPRNDPRVRRVIAGVRRRYGTAQVAKAAVSRAQVDAMVAALGTDLRGLRDRAIVSLGFSTGLRRSELVSLAVTDLAWVAGGLQITISVSKWHDGARRVRAAAAGGPSCPIAAMRTWLDAAGLAEGPVFRRVSNSGVLGPLRLQDRAVARLVKRAAAAAGLDPKHLSGHSLRSGFATDAARGGMSAGQIQKTLGHASPGMTARYVRDSDGAGP